MKKFKDVLKGEIDESKAVIAKLEREHFWMDVFEGTLVRFESAGARAVFEDIIDEFSFDQLYPASGGDIFDAVAQNTGDDVAFNQANLNTFMFTVMHFDKPFIKAHDVRILRRQIAENGPTWAYKTLAKFLKPYEKYPY